MTETVTTVTVETMQCPVCEGQPIYRLLRAGEIIEKGDEVFVVGDGWDNGEPGRKLLWSDLQFLKTGHIDARWLALTALALEQF